MTGVVGRAEALSSIFFIAALMSYAKCTGFRKETGDLIYKMFILYISMIAVLLDIYNWCDSDTPFIPFQYEIRMLGLSYPIVIFLPVVFL